MLISNDMNAAINQQIGREFCSSLQYVAIAAYFDAEHLVLGRFEVHVNGHSLSGTAWGEPLDPARHVLSHEVKAITYHGLRVEPTADGWLAEVIVDI